MALGLTKLIKNIVTTFARQFGASVINLVIVVAIARFFGPEGNGIYSIALLFPQLLATLLNLGLSSSSVYYVNSKKLDLYDVWRETLRLYFALVVVGLLIGAGLIEFYGSVFFKGVPQTTLWLSLAIYPVTLLQSLISGILQTKQDFKSYNLVLLSQPIVILVLAIGLIVANVNDINFFIIAFLCSMVFSVVIGWVRLKSVRMSKPLHPKATKVKRTLLNYGYKTHLGTSIAFLNYRIDLLIVNTLLGPMSAGIYVIAVQLAEKVWLFSKSVSTVLLPRLSELSNDELKRKQTTAIISRWVAVTSALICLGLLVLGQPLIYLIFGDEYSASFLPLILLLPGIILGASSRVLANDISSRGRPEINLYFSLITLVLNVVLNLVLIPLYGLNGGAIATSIAYSINFVFRAMVFRRFTGVSILQTILPSKLDFDLINDFLVKIKKRKGR